MQQRPGIAETLRWYIDAGVDAFIGDVPVDRFTREAESELVGRTVPRC